MRILFLCGREPSYTRNASLLKALAANYEVTDISSSHKSYVRRHLIVLWRLVRSRPGRFDLIFVGFSGYLLIIAVRLLTNKPVILDAYISVYQTFCIDRKKFRPKSIMGRISLLLDQISCRLATVVLLDTNTHIRYFIETFKLPESKFKRVFVGADETVFYPRPGIANRVPLIFTYAQYQPLHGVEHIVRAAKLLNGSARFIIGGTGHERHKIDALLRDEEITNVELIDWIPYAKLPEYIAAADICVGGHLGNTDKAKMVIAGKSFQFIAMNRPTILGRNPANYELIGAAKGIYCEMGSAESLAATIEDILKDAQQRDKLTQSSFDSYLEKASGEAITTRVHEIIGSLAVDSI